ncbi:MAG: PHB depolymerase family esterase [Methylotenera sp.]|nr:PHB depolymerase family esterase [Methylotenera sp.]
MKQLIQKFNIFILLFCLLLSLSTFATAASLRELWQQQQAEKKAEKQQQVNSALNAGTYTFTLEHSNIKRKYMLHIPQNHQAQSSAPLVISLHGGGSNMRYQATDDYYGIISKSESAGFIAVFPNGYSRSDSGKLATWNAGICCGLARDKQIDDVDFIRKVIDDVKTRVNIDAQRIYANGMSNGGMMAYRLACEMPDTIRAIASVTGTDGTQTCPHSKPISVLHIHALDDDRVLFNGGSGSHSSTHANFSSVPDTIAKWVRGNGCNPTPQRILQDAGAYCDVYNACQQNTQVKLCVTETGGHAWPGGKKVRGSTPGSTAINATDLIWDFYERN